ADNPPSGTFYDPDRNAVAMESLGVHEHWNNATDKLYTRNLGKGNGIELFKISNPGGLPVVMSLNRMQLNFAYVMGGSLPGPQSFMITRTGSGVCSWMAEENTSWFDNSPTSGNNAAKITVSVDPSGLAGGTYTGVISVTDLNSSGTALALTVNLKIFSSGTDLQPFGNFATPVEGSTVRSSIPVTGWVLDDVGVESVKIYRQDGAGLVYIGDALTVEGARPDVEIAYPGYPMNYKAGWGYMMLTHFLPGGGNGSFTFYVVARDSSGHEVTLGTRTVTCDNAHAVKPFGAIDTPAQGGEASGLKYRNQGWVLTPVPNNIPSTGKTINVYIDGVYKGHPIYNIYRPDVASLFPGYANSNGSLGYFDFDTTHYDDGVHTIYWVAEDNAGNADGIGSRYFSVRNPVGDRGRQSLGRGEPACPPHSSVLESQFVYARKNGNRIIEIKELERIEIRVGANAVGYQLVAGQRRPLPIGSTLDSGRGIFYWTPGPGFLGKYDFIFIISDKTGRRVPQDITIKIY
ncbi:MAG TPA: hypothetical protein VK186_02065, partial [Candidatus Deferrimicrobium sp.]|nr:hypothetical protein [Candidatus Deferrimicrobium sp.]